MRLALIGFGNIGSVLLPELRRAAHHSLDHLTILVRPSRIVEVEAVLAREWGDFHSSVVASVEQLLAEQPDIVVECAGHSAVENYGPAVLKAGIDLVVVSVGAFASVSLEKELRATAKAAGSRIILPAGAVGGVDLLSALGTAGDVSVNYRGIKPPPAWVGTPAEHVLDLTDVTEPQIIFRGNARQAARDYPKNANVAATLAMAGAGFEATVVELVADPAAGGNVHEYRVVSSLATYQIRIENLPSIANLKTSGATIYSVLREILNHIGPIAI